MSRCLTSLQNVKPTGALRAAVASFITHQVPELPLLSLFLSFGHSALYQNGLYSRYGPPLERCSLRRGKREAATSERSSSLPECPVG